MRKQINFIFNNLKIFNMGENDEKDKPNAYGFMDRFRNAVLGAAMADRPEMMTASGWRLNEKGDYVLDQQNDPHVILLRDNLAAEGAGVMLGEFGIPVAYGLYNLGIRGLAKSGNNFARAKLISKLMNDVVDEGLQYFGKVKYYGPTMGKTTATKTNPDLVDFDDFTREAKNNLAKELNISTRVLQSDPKYALIYLEMLEKELDRWRRNPLNADKTLVISKKGLADKNVYNNEPSIPDRQTFILRLRNRGETDDANSNDWYNMLFKLNPNLKVDNRFISEIEFNPHYIGFLPVKQQSGKTYLGFYERPLSKLTEAERAGLPKGERNQPVRPSLYVRNDAHNSLYTGAAKDNRNLPFSLEDIASAEPQIALNMIRSNKEAERNFKNLYNQILDRAMGGSQQLDDFNSLLLDYIKGLPDPDDMFLNSNGWQSAYVLDYRKYLNNLGYDAATISDYDLAKLISLQYRDLTSTMTGKTKGMVMWHGSPEMFDVFDLTKTGNFTGNMGYGGPGNYFSNARTPYGYLKSLGVMNLQPYLINGILSTPSFSYMVLKGLLPKYISPGGLPTEAYTKMVERLVKETPINDSKLYIDDISLFPANTLDPVNRWKSEYMLRRNDGIKSLFPHPSTFVRNADGSVSVRRDWGDPRVNYFKDKYGKEITPTPYPGSDSDLANAVLHSLRSVLRDYFSPEKVNQIKKTMNWGDLEISELLSEILRTIGNGPDVLIKGPMDGFTDIAQHRGLVMGTGSEAKGLSTVVLNRERIPDVQMALESGIHEIGVHGKTVSLKPENFGKGGRDDMVKEWFPRLAELSLKNKELADLLLQPNRVGKFLGLFLNVGDLEKYFVNKGLSWDKWQKFYDAWKRYKYVTASDETTARAYTGLLFNKVYDPTKKTLNIKLLELYNTPESVEAFKKAVLGVAPVATAASLVPSDKKGSKMLIKRKIK